MTQRRERVASELLKVVCAVVRDEIQDPDLGFVTFLGTDVSGDLRNGTVMYSVMGSDEQKKKTDIIIRNSAKFIKKCVNDQLGLRYAIDLKFERKSDIDDSFRIQNILNEIAEERRRKGEDEPEGGTSETNESSEGKPEEGESDG